LFRHRANDLTHTAPNVFLSPLNCPCTAEKVVWDVETADVWDVIDLSQTIYGALIEVRGEVPFTCDFLRVIFGKRNIDTKCLFDELVALMNSASGLLAHV